MNRCISSRATVGSMCCIATKTAWKSALDAFCARPLARRIAFTLKLLKTRKQTVFPPASDMPRCTTSIIPAAFFAVIAWKRARLMPLHTGTTLNWRLTTSTHWSTAKSRCWKKTSCPRLLHHKGIPFVAARPPYPFPSSDNSGGELSRSEGTEDVRPRCGKELLSRGMCPPRASTLARPLDCPANHLGWRGPRGFSALQHQCVADAENLALLGRGHAGISGQAIEVVETFAW
jgi:hypothetical protein